MTEVYLGDYLYKFPSDDLSEMSDHTELFKEERWDKLRSEMKKQGYLRIKGLNKREDVHSARRAVLEHIASLGDDKFSPGVPLEAGILDSRCGRGCVPFMEGSNSITNCKDVTRVIEGPRVTNFFEKFLGGKVITFDHKWLRGIHKEAYTGVHVDNVYMGRGTQELLTMWSPLGDVSLDMGCLALVPSSHNQEAFTRFQATYGECDLEREGVTGSGWFTENPREIQKMFNCQWKTAEFSAGDVLIFTNRTIHMSTKNTSDKIRISCDTRWQRADQPVDKRFLHPLPQKLDTVFGLWADNKEEEREVKTIETMRKQWDI